MHYLISIAGANGTPVVLGDDKEGWMVQVDAGAPEQLRTVRAHALYRASTKTIYDNFNRSERYGFTVDRTFENFEEAMRHRYLHANDVPNVGNLFVSVDGFEATLRNCFITPKCVRMDGASVVFHYECLGEAWI